MSITLLLSLLFCFDYAVSDCCLLAVPGNTFNEHYWNLVNIVSMVAKQGNISFKSNVCFREAKMFLTSGKNIFCFRAAKFVSATHVSRAANASVNSSGAHAPPGLTPGH